MSDADFTNDDAPVAGGVTAKLDEADLPDADGFAEDGIDAVEEDAAADEATVRAEEDAAAAAAAAEYPEEYAAQRESIWTRVKWGRTVLALVFLFLVVAASLFAWNRWFRYDDALDIQGSWRDVQTGNVMEVNENCIKLAEDAVYEYRIDTVEKTITYTFGDATGQSSYRFSEDRRQLVLEDGAGADWGLALHFYDDPGFSEGELADGLTRLEKISDDVPNISLPGSSRPASPLSHGPSSRLSSEASSSFEPIIVTPSSSAASLAAASSDAASSADADKDDEDDKPKASQTVPDENGNVVGPDRNAKGYYDSNGIFVPVSYGHFNEAGDWIDDIGGYTDASGTWIEGPSGYYGYDGVWVDYATEIAESLQQQNAAAAGGYYDQNGVWVDTTGSAGQDTAGGYYDQNGAWVEGAA